MTEMSRSDDIGDSGEPNESYNTYSVDDEDQPQSSGDSLFAGLGAAEVTIHLAEELVGGGVRLQRVIRARLAAWVFGLHKSSFYFGNSGTQCAQEHAAGDQGATVCSAKVCASKACLRRIFCRSTKKWLSIRNN